MNPNARMDTERFIELVRSYPILYNTNHKQYKNFGQKNEIWEAIAKEMNEPSEALRTKWKGLKDGYTKYKKWVLTQNANVKSYSNWCWGSHLAFMDPFINRRKKTDRNSTARKDNNFLHMEESHDEYLTSNPEDYPQENIGGGHKDLDSELLIKIEPLQATVVSSPSTSRPESRASFRDPINTEADDNTKLLGFMQTKRSKGIDAVDLLFMSYADTFKKFSVVTQTQLKIKMATIFAEAELQEHNLGNNVLS